MMQEEDSTPDPREQPLRIRKLSRREKLTKI